MARRAGAEEEQGTQRRGGEEKGEVGGEGKKETCPQPQDSPSEPSVPAAPLVPPELREVLGLLGAEMPMPGLPESSEEFHNSECPVPGVSGLCDKSEGFWKTSPL